MEKKIWGLTPLNVRAAAETQPEAERFAQNFPEGARPAGCSSRDGTARSSNRPTRTNLEALGDNFGDDETNVHLVTFS